MRGKPVPIGATAGTARHSLALDHAVRPLFTYLRAMVIPTAVFAASEDWGGNGGDDRSLAERIGPATGELADLMATTESGPLRDPHEDVTPFKQMLND